MLYISLSNNIKLATLLLSIDFPFPSWRTGGERVIASIYYVLLEMVTPSDCETSVGEKFSISWLNERMSDYILFSFYEGSIIVCWLISLLFLSSKSSGRPDINRNSGIKNAYFPTFLEAEPLRVAFKRGCFLLLILKILEYIHILSVGIKSLRIRQWMCWHLL